MLRQIAQKFIQRSIQKQVLILSTWIVFNETN